MSGIIILLLFSICSYVFAQSPAPSVEDYFREGSLLAKFEPSIAVVAGVVSVILTLTLILLVYAKCCHELSHNVEREYHGETINVSDSPRFSGLDKTVIESLPFFRFSALKGSRQGLECVVCLSKFKDVEILRLLPMCKHAFHMGCIDQWLEQHATCPLCRNRVNADDPSIFTYSNSLRFLNLSENRADSGLDLYVEREEEAGDEPHRSSRFSVGGSSRKILKMGYKEGEKDCKNRKILHKFNHKIVVSDVVFKNRWSNVSSSDLMFLNSQMLSSMSSERFHSFSDPKESENCMTRKSEEESILRIREEMETKREFEENIGSVKKMTTNPLYSKENQDSGSDSRIAETGRRSMSEITAVPRFSVLVGTKNTTHESCNEVSFSSSCTSSHHVNMKGEKRMRQWLSIARRTVRWYANRERTSQQSQSNNSQPELDV